MPVQDEYLYVNSFDTTDVEWDEIGNDPYLDSTITTNRIESDLDDKLESWFSFEDSAIIDKIKGVYLIFYLKSEAGGNNILRPTINDGTQDIELVPVVINYPSYGWRSWTVSDYLDTWTKINACKLKLQKLGANPQTEQLNVNSLDTTRTGWTRTGNTPYLGAQDQPTNVIVGSDKNDEIGDFSFSNVTPVGIIVSCLVKLYCKSSDANDRIEVYVWDGSWTLGGTITPPGITYATRQIDVSAILNTVTKINNAKMYLVKKTVGSAGIVYVDHAYLEVSKRDLEKIEVACAGLKIEYYEDSVCEDKNPTAHTVDVANWSNPEKAYTSNDDRTSATGYGAKTDYHDYGWDTISMVEVYTVIVKIEGYEGEFDEVGVKVSWDGGSTWSARYYPALDLTESEKQVDVTGVTDWTQSKLSNSNFRVKIEKGEVGGCLAPDSPVDLWVSDIDERIRLKNKTPTITVEKLYDLLQRVKVINLPKLIGIGEPNEFCETPIIDIIKHEGIFKMYHVTLEGWGVKKDVKGSETHVVQTVFRGEIPLRMLKIGDALIGRFWDETIDNYKLKPMNVISIEEFTENVCYEIKTNTRRFFTQYSLQGQVKW